MAAPVANVPDPDPVAPEADPVAIRACLSQAMTVEFDREWEFVLDEAKATKDLAGVHSLLHKWRFIALGELRDPGSHYRMLAKAEAILATGSNPGAVPVADMRALIAERLGR